MNHKKSKTKSRPADAAAGAAGADADAGPMSVGFLQQLVALMSANDLHVVDLREGTRRIRLQRGASAAPQPFVIPAPTVSAQAPPALPAAQAPAAPQPPPAGADEDVGTVAIKSPMVGTFYAASSPDAKPFVTVGSQVDEETDVCIIEAMKVFNNIKAECRGTITKVMVQNGQTVEFGTVLFLVKPA